MKEKINCNEIESGDYIVGFSKVVSRVVRRQNKFGGSVIIVVFEDNTTWKTSNHFFTTVIR